MIKIIFTLLFGIASVSAICQDTTTNKNPSTQIEKFNLRVGTIIKKEFIDLYSYTDKGFYSYGSLQVKVLIYTDAATGQSLRGLMFSSSSYNGYVDEEEIPNLLKYMDFVQTLETQAPSNYTEYNYYCNDMQAFSYFDKPTGNKPGKWVYGFKTDKYYSSSYVRLKIDNIRDLELKIKDYFKL